MRRLSVVWLLVMVGLVGCGQQAVVDVGPTPTRDPLAFYEPTPVSPGRPENPLQILYVPPDQNAPQVATAQQTVGGLLSTRTGLSIQILTVASHADALALLCDTTDGDRFVAAWLNGPTAVLADAQGCGERVLRATFDGQPGLAGEIAAVGGGAIGSLAGRNYCRYRANTLTDFYTWTLPALALQANGIDVSSLEDVVDVPSLDLAAQSTIDGTCYAVGGPEGVLGEASDDALTTIYTSPAVPIGMLFLPPEMLLADRAALIDAYLEIGGYEAPVVAEGTPTAGAAPAAEEDEDAQTFFEVTIDSLSVPDERKSLAWLSGGDGVEPVTETDLDEMREFMSRAGFTAETIALR